MNNSSITVGYMPSLNQISAVTSNGEIQIDFLKKVTEDGFLCYFFIVI